MSRVPPPQRSLASSTRVVHSCASYPFQPLKPEVAPPQPGRDVGGHHGRFDTEGTRAAHEIDEAARRRCDLRPPGARENGCREILLERCLAAVTTIPPAMQTLAGQIDGDSSFVAVDVQIHPQVWPPQLDRRPDAAGFANLIDDGVFDLECRKVGMIDVGFRGVAVYGPGCRPGRRAASSLCRGRRRIALLVCRPGSG